MTQAEKARHDRAMALADLQEHVRMRSSSLASQMADIEDTWPHFSRSPLGILRWMRTQSFQKISIAELQKRTPTDCYYTHDVGDPIMELYGVGILDSDHRHLELAVVKGTRPTPVVWITDAGHAYCDLRWPDDPGCTGWIYRLFGGGDELLYVGISFESPESRIKHHRTKADWGEEIHRWDVRRTSSGNLRRTEAEVIRGERPRYNIQHNQSGLSRLT